jgi:hypothetical protein
MSTKQPKIPIRETVAEIVDQVHPTLSTLRKRREVGRLDDIFQSRSFKAAWETVKADPGFTHVSYISSPLLSIYIRPLVEERKHIDFIDPFYKGEQFHPDYS